MISATIITFNEEATIARCIDSLVLVADEIVVVDSFSTDATEQICRSKGVRFLQHVFEGYVAQKNFADAQATFDYILSVDADECLSDELQKSVLEAKKNLISDGYTMNRLNNFCGTWIYHSGWYPDRKLRLWNRRKGKWEGVYLHEKLVMQAGSRITGLTGDLLHYTVSSVEQFKMQQKKFATIAAKEIAAGRKKSNLVFNLLRAAFMFIRRYFFQLGLLDGYYGFIISAEAMKYTYRKYEQAKQPAPLQA